MILAIDIGNSNIVMGIFKDDELMFEARLATNRKSTEDEYAVAIKAILRNRLNAGMNDIEKEIDGAIISSVVPPLTQAVTDAVEIICGCVPMIVGPGIKTGINVKIDNPSQLGSDMLTNTVAAVTLYSKPVIVVDMGTATTFSVINEKCEFVGGAIVPGVQTSLEALSMRTAQLTHIDIKEPKSVIGTNTIDCMNSGIVFGNAGMIDGIIERIMKNMQMENCDVIATGGNARYIVKYAEHKIIYDKYLLLKGLKIIYDKNKQNK